MLSASESNILNAFKRSHRGYSIDAVICTDSLRQEFLNVASKTNPGTSEVDLLWKLLNIRKRSEIGSISSIRTNINHDRYEYAARRAAISLQKSDNASIDKIICDTNMRTKFDRIAQNILERDGVINIDISSIRLAALSLRKQG